jgi:hypothetical protein
MPKKSRKYSKKTAKTRKQRGGFMVAPMQEGGSWLSGLTDKVKGLFSIDQQLQEPVQQVATQQAAHQATAQVTVPPSESIRLQPQPQLQPGWTNVPLNATPRKRKNNLNNWSNLGRHI